MRKDLKTPDSRGWKNVREQYAVLTPNQKKALAELNVPECRCHRPGAERPYTVQIDGKAIRLSRCAKCQGVM